MNPAAQDVDTAPRYSGSQIIYKATPAVGADGQNIMKLIPVQMVKSNLALKTGETLDLTNPAPAQVDLCVTRFVRREVSLGNVLPNKRNVHHEPPPQKQPQLNKAPLIETPAAHCETSETLPGHCSLHCHKQIQRVPAPGPPPPNNRDVFTPSANSSPGFCVSPIDPVNMDALPKSTSAPPSFRLLPNQTPPLGPKPSLKLILRTPRRPDSPIRWMVEEDDSSAPPVLPSYSVASEILRTLAERERAHQQLEVMGKSTSLMSQDSGAGQREEEALVLSNGKVFRKHPPPLQTRKSDSSTTETKSYIFTKTTSPSEPAQRRHVHKLIISRRSHEVRDFCDEAQDETKASAVTSPDEDNVIFMSYTPPTSKSPRTEDLTLKTQTAAVRGADPPAGVNIRCEKHSNMSRSAQQVACTEHSADTTSDSDSTGSAADVDAWIKESFGNPEPRSRLKPAPEQVPDHLLRRMFGITADVKICLQRMDEASAGPPVERHHSKSKPTEVRHQEPTSKVHEEELFLTEVNSPYESDSYSGSISVKSEEVSADSASLTPQTLSKCSHLETETKLRTHSVQSDAETDALIGYMEPIDEDFFSTDEKDVTAGTREDKKRIGRTRKRTMCPCCVSGTQNQALKLSLKTVFPGKKSGAKTARKCARTSGKVRCPTAKRKNSDSLSCSSSGDSDELRCHEEIRRLRELLREKEEALELLRRNSS